MSDVGSAPDGLGEYLTSQAPVVQAEAPALQQQQAPMAGFGDDVAQPIPNPAPTAPPASASARAGLTLVGATAATGIGYALGGGWGALAGLFLAGSARNSFRASAGWASADQTEKSESRKSAIVAVIGLGASGYFFYRAYTRDER